MQNLLSGFSLIRSYFKEEPIKFQTNRLFNLKNKEYEISRN